MAPEASDFTARLEPCLNEALSVLVRTAGEIGAHSVSVSLVAHDQSAWSAYRWPDSMTPAPDEARGRVRLEWQAGWTGAESAMGRFLNRTTAPAAGSFLLFAWPEQRPKVVIAFGFASAPAGIKLPSETAATLRLAAFAAWTAYEVRRLRCDLRVVNERLGQRKTVDRAKGLLQARHGWSEQQAYDHLRRLSRQRRKPMADTAQDLLRISQSP